MYIIPRDLLSLYVVFKMVLMHYFLKHNLINIFNALLYFFLKLNPKEHLYWERSHYQVVRQLSKSIVSFPKALGEIVF